MSRGTGEKMSEDMTIIYVTRPYGHNASLIHTDEYLQRIGTPMHCGKTKHIKAGDEYVAVCNTFCIDGYVDRVRLKMMLNKEIPADRYYIEIWSDVAERDTTEHECCGYNGHRWAPVSYECFTTSLYPDVTPEYLTEDYAVAFLNDSAEGDVLDTCSFTCRKW